MIARRERIALAAAAGFAVLMPLVLLVPGSAPRQAAAQPPRAPLAAHLPATPAALYERSLFGAAPASGESAAPADAPALVGIVGRLGEDAVALIRTSEGTTRALRVGESVDGWTLASLAIDAAFFTRGAQRARVPLPAGE